LLNLYHGYYNSTHDLFIFRIHSIPNDPFEWGLHQSLPCMHQCTPHNFHLDLQYSRLLHLSRWFSIAKRFLDTWESIQISLPYFSKKWLILQSSKSHLWIFGNNWHGPWMIWLLSHFMVLSILWWTLYSRDQLLSH
jgi:hypothetical protein